MGADHCILRLEFQGSQASDGVALDTHRMRAIAYVRLVAAGVHACDGLGGCDRLRSGVFVPRVHCARCGSVAACRSSSVASAASALLLPSPQAGPSFPLGLLRVRSLSPVLGS